MSGWADSDRRSTLPADWDTAVRPRILRRDRRRCTWLGDPNHDGHPERYLAGDYTDRERCTAPATDVDHIGNALDHADTNLRALCARHHGRRSALQGVAAKARMRRQRLRPQRPHPGLRSQP